MTIFLTKNYKLEDEGLVFIIELHYNCLRQVLNNFRVLKYFSVPYPTNIKGVLKILLWLKTLVYKI